VVHYLWKVATQNKCQVQSGITFSLIVPINLVMILEKWNGKTLQVKSMLINVSMNVSKTIIAVVLSGKKLLKSASYSHGAGMIRIELPRDMQPDFRIPSASQEKLVPSVIQLV